jgi:hypothetical protein
MLFVRLTLQLYAITHFMALETATRLARRKEIVILPNVEEKRLRSHLGHRSSRDQGLSVADDFQEEYKAGRGGLGWRCG